MSAQQRESAPQGACTKDACPIGAVGHSVQEAVFKEKTPPPKKKKKPPLQREECQPAQNSENIGSLCLSDGASQDRREAKKAH